MIKTKLPIVEKTIDEGAGKLIAKEREIDVSIDTSLFAEERWEKYFPHNARTETLFAYIERAQASGLMKSRAHILSNLKALYCFMEGDEISDFKSFCQLFDLADGKHLEKLTKKISFVFEIVLNSSTVSPKN